MEVLVLVWKVLVHLFIYSPSNYLIVTEHVACMSHHLWEAWAQREKNVEIDSEQEKLR